MTKNSDTECVKCQKREKKEERQIGQMLNLHKRICALFRILFFCLQLIEINFTQ